MLPKIRPSLPVNTAEENVPPPAAWVVIVAAPVILYLIGYSAGLITVVGHQSGSSTQQGFVGVQALKLNLSWSPWLVPGEALRADYKVKAPYGSLRLAAHSTLYPWHGYQNAWAHISGDRTGSVLFVAQEAHFFRFKLEGTVGYGRVCRAQSVASAILPTRDCPTYDVEYSVTWHRVPAGQVAQIVAAGIPQVLIPRRNEPLMSIVINDCGGRIVCM